MTQTNLKILKDFKFLNYPFVYYMDNSGGTWHTMSEEQKEAVFSASKDLRAEAIKRINFLESLNMICHQWVANEWRTFIDYWDRKPKVQKAEKKYAIIQVKWIMKDYSITDEELK